MTAAAVLRNTPEMDDGVVKKLNFPVKGNQILYAGTMVVTGVDGYAKVPTAVTTDQAWGRCEKTVDATGLADGVARVDIKRGCFPWANSAAGDQITIADRGKNAYAVDNQTVAKTDNSGARSIAGRIVDVDSQGVWVETIL